MLPALAILITAAWVALFCHLAGRVPKLGKIPPAARAGLALLAAWAVAFGGSKGGRVIVSDPYVRDAGSYLTNDVAHIAVAKVSPLLPDDTEILVYARELGQTNATDWVRLTPYLTIADHPHDYALPNATNHDVTVAANYTPAPVHTNGVWSINGFLIPGSGGRMGFKQTRTVTIEDNGNE